jgi:UDP-glucose 4-epimerase
MSAAAAAGVGAFVYTSTTSAFGDALVPPPGAPAAWITEEVTSIPKNIYGVTKTAAEDLCRVFHRNGQLACVVLRTPRRHAPALGFRRYIISATSPFAPGELAQLRSDAPAVVRRHVPEYEAQYTRRSWRMLPGIDRVYVNERARTELGWRPRYDFRLLIERLRAGEDPRSPLARLVGSKGYHGVQPAQAPYPVE